ncbi:hypothetical protein [Sphingorhabdus sp. SMR4y]|uniref:hypothetical protein n=1 Tax=Sphingorhabdus sp. SMR4y TaxID=2584094 RepID=UPI000B5CD848|nr:hypothetical protein [Sphingorhabdus sp. SMR4y]ASK87267.1 hypothetical protein SPHFLASMR4Y_00481 [Sphingorhabdus sp. SMR4y]
MEDAALRRDIDLAIEEYERLIGGYATYTHRMIDTYGPKEALCRLMADSKIQKGLKTLARAGKLDISFEAIVVRHRGSFRQPIIDAAEWRLERARLGDFD